MFVGSEVLPDKLRIFFVGYVAIVVRVQVLEEVHQLLLPRFALQIREGGLEQHYEVMHSQNSLFKLHELLVRV